MYVFSNLLKEKDNEVWSHLEAVQLSPLFYAVRWLMLMLTQDLEMPDILRVWDMLLSDVERPHPFLLYLCVARLVLIREVLLAANFAECLKIVQQYPPCLVDDMVNLAKQMRSQDLMSSDISSQGPERNISSAMSRLKSRLKHAKKRLEASPDTSGAGGWMRSRLEAYAPEARARLEDLRKRYSEAKEGRLESSAEAFGAGGWMQRFRRRTASSASGASAGSDCLVTNQSQDNIGGYGGSAHRDSAKSRLLGLNDFLERPPLHSAKPQWKKTFKSALSGLLEKSPTSQAACPQDSVPNPLNAALGNEAGSATFQSPQRGTGQSVADRWRKDVGKDDEEIEWE